LYNIYYDWKQLKVARGSVIITSFFEIRTVKKRFILNS
jgi:hypothetical protein